MDIFLSILTPLAVFGGFVFCEWRWPRRVLQTSRLRRWPNNIGVTLANKVMFRFLLPISVPGTALFISEQGWGLMNWLGSPIWVAYPLTFVALDFVYYAYHYATHHIPLLWRMHRMHHSDTDFDVTTAVRTHPFDLALGTLPQLAVVVLCGMPAEAILAFQVYSGLVGKFCHSNIHVPSRIDAVLRWLIVTPDLHRVHHSAWRVETDSNFSAVFPWWDRIFGTYRAQPVAGHAAMVVGIETYREPVAQRLDRLLLLPFLPVLPIPAGWKTPEDPPAST